MTENWRIKRVQKLIDWLLPGYSLVAPAYEQVDHTREWVMCGSGPEEVVMHRSANPNWLWNKAANAVAIAKWLEKNGA